VLVDPVNVRNPHASLTLLTVGPARRVAMHRHPNSAKILYLLKGRARVLGPTGTPPIKADHGTAVFLPQAYPHVIENMARQEEAVLLQIFSPPGPERVYRDPKDPEARTQFEVIRDPRVKAPEGVKPVMATWERPAAPGGQGKSRAHVLLDEKTTGSPAMSLSVLELGPGVALPRHSHPGASELLYVIEGGGKLTVGAESTPFGPATALYLPPDQAHDLKVSGGTPTVLLQVFSPGGSEQQLTRPGAAPAGK
jgi:quercetin dioxygenase-like cupin family protein